MRIGIYLWILAGLWFGSVSLQIQAQEPGGFGGGEIAIPRDYLTDMQRQEIMTRISTNIETLQGEGKLLPREGYVQLLHWPVRLASGVNDYSGYAVSGFVDHNAAYPDQLLDYYCGSRTYDLGSGYNHKGTDIFTWPFSWNKMDNNEIEVIAAAAGVIVGKADGNYDRNCGFGSGSWNAVYILHSRGNIMKILAMASELADISLDSDLIINLGE